jgi:hypothetical protein
MMISYPTVKKLGWFLILSVAALGCVRAAGTKTGTTSTNANAAPAYEGFHDTADCERITGWVWDSTRPDEPLKVDIYDGNEFLATVAADSYRAGLVKHEKGNGKHAFVWQVPQSLKDGKEHHIHVRVSGTDVNLYKTPKTIKCP